MWILPKNYQLSSPYVQDMVESKEDLTLPGLNIKSSLMWRSKPSPLRTWLPRWKRVSWMPHLCGRILKPCQWSRFEIELTSSLAVIRANLLAPQESDLEKKTQDTCGLTSETSSEQLDLFGASLRTSKDTLVSDSEKSLATWKALVIRLRGEYSQRVKSALLIRESESTSWPTPKANMPGMSAKTSGRPVEKSTHLSTQVALAEGMIDKKTGRLWPTPTTQEVRHLGATLTPAGRRLAKDGLATHSVGLADAIAMDAQKTWRTPAVQESGITIERLVTKDGGTPRSGERLYDKITERGSWPTPRTSDYKGPVKPETLLLKGRNPMTNSLMDATQHISGAGHLNPDWVEWLMGVPTGWTELDFSETE